MQFKWSIRKSFSGMVGLGSSRPISWHSIKYYLNEGQETEEDQEATCHSEILDFHPGNFRINYK